MIFKRTLEITGHAGAIYDLAVLDEFVYSCSADKYATRWSLKTGEQDNFAIQTSSTAYSIEIDRKSKTLWLGLSNGDIHIIDIATKTEIKYFKQHKKPVFSIHYLSLIEKMCVGDADGNLSIWDSNSNKLEALLPLDCGKLGTSPLLQIIN